MRTQLATALRCARCEAELEEGDLRCPVCALAAPIEARKAPTAPDARIIRCENCGASVAWSAEAQGLACAYCGSVTHVEVSADPLVQAEGGLPFQVSPEQAKAMLHAFLGKKSFFRPNDLVSASRLDSLRAMWWPAWLTDATAKVAWAADLHKGGHRSDWAPYGGEVDLRFDDLCISASRGLTHQETSALVPSYDLARTSPTPAGPEGAHVERFDVHRSGARAHIQAAIDRTAEAEVAARALGGERHRNLHVSVLLRGLESRRLSLPAYVLAYRYRGKLYRVVLSGQQASFLVGNAPISPWKVLLAVLGALAGVALIALIFVLVLGH